MDRNVELFDSNGNVVAGFWQYGTLQWDEFYRYLNVFIRVEAGTRWKIFQYDGVQRQHVGELCPPGPQIVQPGQYILLSKARDPVPVELLSARPRPYPRSSTHPNTPARLPNLLEPIACSYLPGTSSSHADGAKCLVTGMEFKSYSRLQATHVFPRAYSAEWTTKGYPSKIIDTADVADMGGESKIDSLQNLITLRRDLHNAWVNYEFGVDPKNNYRITSFIPGNEDINGKYLQLDHIQDPTTRPLDELFVDHFKQGLLKYMKGPGTGEENWAYEDWEDAFGDGSSLENSRIWGTGEGKERFEVLLEDRLFEYQASIGK